MNKLHSLFRRKKVIVKHPDLLRMYYEPDVYEGYLWYWADLTEWMETSGVASGKGVCEHEKLNG